MASTFNQEDVCEVVVAVDSTPVQKTSDLTENRDEARRKGTGRNIVVKEWNHSLSSYSNNTSITVQGERFIATLGVPISDLNRLKGKVLATLFKTFLRDETLLFNKWYFHTYVLTYDTDNTIAFYCVHCDGFVPLWHRCWCTSCKTPLEPRSSRRHSARFITHATIDDTQLISIEFENDNEVSVEVTVKHPDTTTFNYKFVEKWLNDDYFMYPDILF